MNKKIINSIVSIICVAVLLLTGTFTAFAETIDFNRKGSISITLIDYEKDIPIKGAEFAAVKVASIDISGDFIPEPFIVENEIDINNAEAVFNFVSENDQDVLKGSLFEEYTYRFSDLSLGIYLIYETKSADGYYPLKPFLAQVPATAEDGESIIYDIEAFPKLELLPKEPISITVKKVWSDDGNNRPEYITVQLSNGVKVIDTVELSDGNNWAHTWEQLDAQHNYSVAEVNVPQGYRVSYDRSGNIITVTNSAELIQTGQLNWPIPVLIVSGLAMIVIGVFFIVKKR